MPTARELLDQADALMRRNRSLAGDDIPVLTEAVPPEMAAQMTQSDLYAAGLAAPRERFVAPPPASEVLDDVPVLTDAVEELEMPSVLDPEGEPSVWLDFDDDNARSVIDVAADSIVVVPEIERPEPRREEADAERDFAQELQPPRRDAAAIAEVQPAQPGEVSDDVVGFAAGSEEELLIDEQMATQDEEVVDVAFALQPDEAIAEEPSPLSDKSAVVEETAVQAVEPVAEAFAPQPDEPVVAEAFAPQPDEPVVAEALAPQPDEPVVAEALAEQPDEPVVAEALAPQPDEPVVAEALAPQPDEPVVAEALAEQPDEVTAGEAARQSTEFAAVQDIASSPPPAMEEGSSLAPALRADDDARWTAMAEDIRMQVLQRIDLFTDTGLREQLGVHLQPIVDRASAELVAAINREVGELLRAYVSEAIEREIERWRQENGGIR